MTATDVELELSKLRTSFATDLSLGLIEAFEKLESERDQLRADNARLLNQVLALQNAGEIALVGDGVADKEWLR